MSTYLGIDPPISTSGATNQELRGEVVLERYLVDRDDIYETSEGQAKRKVVVKKISDLLIEWARQIGQKRGISSAIVERGGGIQLRIFGSTRLDVHTPDADIDSLCLAPSFISRHDFFASFCEKLSTCADVSKLSAVPEAYTPVVKFYFAGQPIDRVFVSLGIVDIPKDLDILNDDNLQGLGDSVWIFFYNARIHKFYYNIDAIYHKHICT